MKPFGTTLRAGGPFSHGRTFKGTAIHAQKGLDPYKVLGIRRNSSRTDIRQAYLEQIRQYHPDVSTDADTTEVAAQLNAAYQELMQGEKGTHGDEADILDVFDSPEAEPDQLFVNPFLCNINPPGWQKLQDVAQQGGDPREMLSRSGVYASDSAVCYVTPAQLADLQQDLEDMELSLSYQVTAWTVADKLTRARIANKRMPVKQ